MGNLHSLQPLSNSLSLALANGYLELSTVLTIKFRAVALSRVCLSVRMFGCWFVCLYSLLLVKE